MMKVVDEGLYLGSIHRDRDGWVAWDSKRQWLGRSEKARFKSMAAAINAILSASHRHSIRPGRLEFLPDL
jgi:hypothetical protein